jgi:hypothetical protein
MSVDGTWAVTMTTPMGAQAITLTLASDGGTLTGDMKSPQGNMELSDGTVDGDSVAWKVAMTSPMPMTLTFTGAVDGDKISGNAELGSFGNAPFEGTRS